jgi:hypothetical protein
MGKQDKRLSSFFEPPVPDFGKHHRQGYLNDIAQKNEDQIIQQGVPGDIPKVPVPDQKLKVSEADKGAAENPLGYIVIHKGNIGSGHGYVMKNNKIQYRRQQHEKKNFVFPKLMDKIVPKKIPFFSAKDFGHIHRPCIPGVYKTPAWNFKTLFVPLSMETFSLAIL